MALAALLLLMAAGASDGATEDSREVVQASDILAAIERGEPVEYDGVIVEGDLDLSGLDLPTEHDERTEYEIWVLYLVEEVKVIESPINITNSEIRGKVIFGSAIFQENVNFTHTKFNATAWFLGSKFSKDAYFMTAMFSGGDAYFDGVNFSGDVNFSEAKFGGYAGFWGANFDGDSNFWGANFDGYASFLQANFDSYVGFEEGNFKGNANFWQANFSDDARFSEANFSGYVNFAEVNFNGDASFSEANFRSSAGFMEVNFSGNASFEWVNFAGYAGFGEANFSGNASFLEVNFSGDAGFGEANFGGNADFSEANFAGYAGFWGANFSGYVNFWMAKFSGYAGFWEANFSRYVNFWEANFAGDAFFMTTQFNNTTSFEKAQFDKEANFNDAQFNGIAMFYSTVFKEDALFENTTFKGELSLTRARYNKLYIRWHNIEGGLAYDDAAYLTLLKNFKDMGYFEDYDYCYFEYRKERRCHPWPLVGDVEETAIRKPIDYFLQVAYGYGTKPLNALLFSLGIISAFGVFWCLIGFGKTEVTPDEYSLANARPYDMLEILTFNMEVLVFSATVFLSGTRLLVEPPPLPKIRGRSRSMIRCAFILERVLGTLFSILFFLAISGTVIRQI